MEKPIITRFPPSPTGYMHIGNVRSCLYGWLAARQTGGKIILRIEDTDKVREVPDGVAIIKQTFTELGLNWDEEYLQSERLDIYHQWAQKLVDKGLAYADPYTSEQVQQFREQAQAEKRPFLYRNHRPETPPVWQYKNQPLRLKSNPIRRDWHDEVRGELSAGEESQDDFILIKSDGYPTYNFAHIIDDHLMGITHIFRADEFISSTPNYLNLYEALEIEQPKLVTLPPILAPTGNKKLGKRDGAKSALEYLEEGYLPDALLSFLALLGWNDGTEQEVYSRKDLIEKFSIDRIGKSGARYDEVRLNWTNGHFIREMPLEELFEKVETFWPEEASNVNSSHKLSVLKLVQERLKFFAELPDLSRFFFTDLPVNTELVTNNKQLKKVEPSILVDILKRAEQAFKVSNFSAQDLQEKLNMLLEETGQKPAVLFSIIRIATTWAPASPQLNQTLEVLGKDLVMKRLQVAAETIAKLPSDQN